MDPLLVAREVESQMHAWGGRRRTRVRVPNMSVCKHFCKFGSHSGGKRAK